ncbi:MAG TPA: YncE family protein [Bryobacteraceae bacterium]|jgi:DNA-binding beta-propeller fold protein YncE|nr:YncE family protein [Bryobacteraceae bacterium]
MTRLKWLRVTALLCGTAGFASAQSYRLAGSIPIGGTGGWDYLTADAKGDRLYVSHTSVVEVIDLGAEKPLSKITGMNRIHGIALAEDLGLGFISDGGANEVVVFDIASLQVKNRVKAGTNPDGILYDPFTKRVFAFNGRSQDATVIDGASGKVVGTIALGGKPEFPTSDAKGYVYDNIEDKNEIVKIDAKKMTVEAHWSVAPCDSPSGMAIDRAHNVLFSVCDGKVMAVVDASSRKVIATPAIGEGPDAAAYDPETELSFSSNGEGTLTVVKRQGNNYVVAQTVQTQRGSRTMALNPSSHKIYLAAADFDPAPAATAQNPRPRPQIKPGSFRILVVAP